MAGRAMHSIVLTLLLAGCNGDDLEPANAVPREPAPTPPAETSDCLAVSPLQLQLACAIAAKGPEYVPRTRHLNADGSAKYTNRLILEPSPYLVQHAHNPVDWYPWGDEAFETARKLGRPIFLSVGYSTCHWCHVMEEESFEDEEIARYLNEYYVAVKVDREERPDVDAAYMTFVQALTRGGGWPMNVWLTPAREPFYGGTYFAPRAGVRGAQQGFIDVLREQSERYARNPAAVAEVARSYTSRLQEATTPEPPGTVSAASVILAARAEAASRFDPVAGGAKGRIKFPATFPVRLLLRIARREKDAEALRMATTTLEHMHAGGIHDHVGGGFHRYSTDPGWLVPHFEKMLYDNALLALAYLEASQASGDPRFAATARETLDYLLREMRSPEGAFYSATDADSAGSDGRREEGLFFTWTPAELREVLGNDDARLAAAWFAVTEAGNFDGRSVLSTPRSLEAVAGELELDADALGEEIPAVRGRLFEARARRPPPLRDDKVIVAWNGLVVSALARAAIVLGDSRYGEAGVRAASALVAPVRAGRPLPHSFMSGEELGRAFADDLALLAAALLDVFEVTAEPAWLRDAASLMEELERSFADRANGGYFLAADSGEPLMLREKPANDGPVPGVSSVAALTWLRLYAFTDDERYRERAEATMKAFASTLSSRPLALDHMLHAADWASDRALEIVVVVPEGKGALEAKARPFVDVLQKSFLPNAVLVVGSESELGAIAADVEWVQDKRMKDARPTVYVCERGTCKAPTTDAATFAGQVAVTAPYR